MPETLTGPTCSSDAFLTLSSFGGRAADGRTGAPASDNGGSGRGGAMTGAGARWVCSTASPLALMSITVNPRSLEFRLRT